MKFNGQNLATGTGFVLNSAKGPVLVTNRHNLTGRWQKDNKPLSKNGGIPNKVEIFHHATSRLGHWVPKTEPLYSDQDSELPRWIEHPVLGAKADFVALPLTQLDTVALYPYGLANPGQHIKIGPAEIVSVIGFPFGKTAGGYFPIWVTGFTASEPDIDFDNLPIQLIDCRSRPGQSGSPVVAVRASGFIPLENGDQALFGGPVHKMIGIYSGRIRPESDLGIVWKTSAIAELIDSI